MSNDPTEEKFKLLVELWSAENAVKTQKLMMYFVANALLVSALASSRVIPWVISLIGVLFSLFWFFCIGRTVAYQKYGWGSQIEEIHKNNPNNPLFDIFPKDDIKKKFPFYGVIPAKFVLLGPPIAGFLIWLIVLVKSIP